MSRYVVCANCGHQVMIDGIEDNDQYTRGKSGTGTTQGEKESVGLSRQKQRGNTGSKRYFWEVTIKVP